MLHAYSLLCVSFGLSWNNSDAGHYRIILFLRRCNLKWNLQPVSITLREIDQNSRWERIGFFQTQSYWAKALFLCILGMFPLTRIIVANLIVPSDHDLNRRDGLALFKLTLYLIVLIWSFCILSKPKDNWMISHVIKQKFKMYDSYLLKNVLQFLES